MSISDLLKRIGLGLGRPRRVTAPIRRAPGRCRPALERLEDRAVPTANYLTGPLTFEENLGQGSELFEFLSRHNGYALGLDQRGPKFAVGESVLDVRLLGADPTAAVAPGPQAPTVSQYVIGKDPANWLTDVPHVTDITYTDIYPGIDVTYAGTDRQRLVMRFTLDPGVGVATPPAGSGSSTRRS